MSDTQGPGSTGSTGPRHAEQGGPGEPGEEQHPLAPPPRPRRVPGWLIAVAGVVVLVLVGVAIALAVNNRTTATPAAPDPVVVTLPPPTPTIDPVQPEAGTAFAQSLPTTVLQYALTESAEHADLVVAGALEGHRLVYSDGGDGEMVVLAGQWRDADGAAAAFAERLAAVEAEAGEEPASPEATAEGTAGPTYEPTAGGEVGPSEGDVEVDGTVVGTYAVVPHGDGTGTVLWTNQTAMFEVTGPVADLTTFFTAFPL